jgi:ABC-type arginine/histidine transport system permease subunit
VFLVAAAALFDLRTLWLVPAALLLGIVRAVARWAAARYGRALLRAPGLPPHFGLGTVAQGGVPLALAVSFNLIYVGAGGGGAILATVLLGVAFSQAIAAPLMALALRAAPPEVT